ncbi:MAG TPA: DUF2169 domain-containing protein [Bryobacteraceae bacterium]|nr:DUF2169 domain-containing protein [Bryobacteraceae bacterium]
MTLLDTTATCARLVSAPAGGDRNLAAVVARATFDIARNRLVFSPERPWPAGAEAIETPWGTFPPDTPFPREGIDVFVLGCAWQPHGLPATELTLAIRVGAALERRIAVIGDRTWVRRDGTLVPGEPRQFVSMPLTYENAYGGRGAANPVGKGWNASEAEALGQPLPNLEDADARIRSFADHPDPVGTSPCPKRGGRSSLVIDPERAPHPGTLVEVTHATPEGALRFALPDLRMHVRVADQLLPLLLDEIAVFTGPRRVSLAYRAEFEYAGAPPRFEVC